MSHECPAVVLPESIPPLRRQVSLFRGAKDARPVQRITLAHILEKIRTDRKYEGRITQLRGILKNQGQGAYDHVKKNLDAFTAGGTFCGKRSKDTLDQHSGVAHGDLDHVEDVQGIKALLCGDLHTVYCFISPGGEGLKVGVRVVPIKDDKNYKHAWQTVADYHREQYGVVWDASGKDISRLCFTSWDPQCYTNDNATCFDVPAQIVSVLPLRAAAKRAVPSEERASTGVGPIPQGERNSALFRFGCALRGSGHSEASILRTLEALNTERCQPPLDGAEIETIVHSVGKYSQGSGMSVETTERSGHTLVTVVRSRPALVYVRQEGGSL